MENTGNVLFDDRTQEWFVALGNRWQGPMTAAEVYRKVVNQDISWAHFIWKKGQPNWSRICDTPTFQPAVPHAPTRNVQEEVRERSQETQRSSAKPSVRQAGPRKGPPPAPTDDEDVDQKIWCLYFNSTQFGPFSSSEIEAMLDSGKIQPRVHVWKDGMSGWERLERLPQFQQFLTTAPAIPAPTPAPSKKKSEQREGPRRPLVAKILLSNDESVVVGVCRDISVGGMQVLTDRIPGEVGSKVKLNVSPPDGEKGKFKPFVAHGRIVRLLEDGRGFSFRFERITDAAKRAIDAYIATSE